MKKTLIIIAIAIFVGAGGIWYAVRSGNTTEESAEVASDNTSPDSLEAEKPESKFDLKKQVVGQQPDCSLYTFEELGKVWGVTFTDTDVDGSKVRELNGPNSKLYECDYNETDSGKGLTFTIQYKEYPDEAGAKSSIEGTRQGAKIGDKVYFTQDEVPGLGDEAFFSTSATSTFISEKEEQLYLRKGNVVMLITAVNLDGKDATYRDKIIASYRLHFE